MKQEFKSVVIGNYEMECEIINFKAQNSSTTEKGWIEALMKAI